MRISNTIPFLFISIFFLGFWGNSLAQQKNLPLAHFYNQEVERAALYHPSHPVHTASKPFLESHLDLKNVVGFQKDDSLKTYLQLTKILFKSHLISVKGDDYSFTVDPVLNLTLANDFLDKSKYADTVLLFNSTRGFQIAGDLGKKFSFQTSFYETQTFFPSYIKSFVDSTSVAPGFGRAKQYRTYGYDFAMANGHISYSPAVWLNLQFGHGKHFIGHGYRSLLLSDAAFNYPYVKAIASLFQGKLLYTATYASLQTLQRLPLGEVPEALFKRKGASFNYLSWIPHHRLEVGLFEGVIWQRYDNTRGTIPQPYGAYIPVLGVNTAINGFDAIQNVMVGANLKIVITRNAYVYGQLALDNPSENRWAYQTGIKCFDCIIPGLAIQTEWNHLNDLIYTSQYPIQNYVHINQPLGHPTGPATQEWLIMVNYRWRRVIGQAKFNTINHQTDYTGNWKANPSIARDPNTAAKNQQIIQMDIYGGLLINPKWNLQAIMGYTYRQDKHSMETDLQRNRNTSLIYFALRTNLLNQYSDF